MWMYPGGPFSVLAGAWATLSEAYYSNSLLGEVARRAGGPTPARGCRRAGMGDIPGMPVRVDYMLRGGRVADLIALEFFVGG